MKVVALISGGKDSCFNMMHCVAMGHKIVALANLQPKVKDELDSYMYQTVGHEGIELYSQAMDLPLYRRFIEGSSHSKQMNYATDALDEVEDLYKLLKQIKGELEFDAVSCGAILSDYQRIRVEHVCQRLDLVCLSYLWRQNQQELMQDMIDMEVEAVIIKVAALGLNQNHLGKTLNEVQQHLLKLNQKYGCHICGEGGEYETFTTDCPLFKRKIVIDKSKVIVHSDDFCGAPVAYLRLESLHLEDKTHNLQALKILSEKYIVNFQDIDFDSISLHSKMTKNSSLRNNSLLSSVNNQKEPVLIKCYEQYCAISNLSGNVVEKSSVDSVQKAAKHVLTQLVELLKENGHTTKDVCYIHLYIGDMSDFIAINNIYKEFFAYNPPARVCIGLPILSEENTNLNTVLTLDCVSCKSDSDIHSKVMHVQGISHWAPANIGPYSQCVQRGDLFFVAGQIGLLPGTMELIEGGCFSQACLSLQHAHSVLQAMKNDLGSGNITQCVCYITNRSYLNAAQNAEKYVMGAGVILPVLYVVIPQLPKNALVEWQVIASSSQTTIPVCLYTSAMKPNLSLLDTFNNLLNEIKRAVKKDNLDWNQVLQIRLFYVKELVGPPLIAQRGDLEGDFPSICCIPVQAIFGREAKSELSMAAFGLIVAKS